MCSSEKDKDQLELPLPKDGTAYPEGVQFDLTTEFNKMLQQICKPNPVGKEETSEDGATVVWECLGCGKQARRITELLGRRIVNAKLTPE